jgi:hypothetical protein
MLVSGDHDRHLPIAKTLHQIEGCRICGDIDDVIFDALTIERACRCGALDAGWLAVNGDVHGFLVVFKKRAQEIDRASADARSKAQIPMLLCHPVSGRRPSGYSRLRALKNPDMVFTPKLFMAEFGGSGTSGIISAKCIATFRTPRPWTFSIEAGLLARGSQQSFCLPEALRFSDFRE